MKTHTCPTNLTDAEWAWLEPLFPVARTGHPRHHSLRTIVDALLYVLRMLNDETRARLPRMQHLWLNSGYNGRGKGSDWVETTVGWTVQVLRALHGFKRYWVPERNPTGPD
jgi:transposase